MGDPLQEEVNPASLQSAVEWVKQDSDRRKNSLVVIHTHSADNDGMFLFSPGEDGIAETTDVKDVRILFPIISDCG